MTQQQGVCYKRDPITNIAVAVPCPQSQGSPTAPVGTLPNPIGDAVQGAVHDTVTAPIQNALSGLVPDTLKQPSTWKALAEMLIAGVLGLVGLLLFAQGHGVIDSGTVKKAAMVAA